MSTTTQRPTPETDALSDSRIGMWAFNLPIDFSRKLERERDEAMAKLSTVYRWIESNHPDGFIDSQSHLQNLDRVADAWHDKLEAMRDERDQLSRDLSSLLAGDCLDGHDAVEGVRNGIAMREAIREAHEALVEAADYFRLDGRSVALNLPLTPAALAKLSEFIDKPNKIG